LVGWLSICSFSCQGIEKLKYKKEKREVGEKEVIGDVNDATDDPSNGKTEINASPD